MAEKRPDKRRTKDLEKNVAIRLFPALFLSIAVLLAGLAGGACYASATQQEVLVGSELEFPPYALVDKDGKPAGFSVDLIKATADAMGMPIKMSSGTWDSVWNSLVEGRIDVLPIVAKTPGRTALVDFSLPHTETYDAFFTRQGAPAIKSIGAATGKEVVVMRSDAAHHALLDRNFKGRIMPVDTIPEGLSLIASGKHDAFLCSKLIGVMEAEEHGINGLAAGPPIPDYKRSFSFAVKKGDSELLEKLNQGLLIIKTNGEYDRIYEKWLTVEDPWQRYKKYLRPAAWAAAALAVLVGSWAVMLHLLVRRRTRELAEKNEMLRQAREGLEKTVAQRTSELTGANAALQSEVAERKRAEERQRLLSEFAGMLLSAEAPEKIVRDIAGKVMARLDCQAFFNFIVDEDKGRLRLNACGGIPVESAKDLEWLDYGAAVCGTVAESGERMIKENILRSPDGLTELVHSFGIDAYACHPLVSKGKVIGTLSFGTRTRPRFSVEDIEFMQVVADQVAVAMERKQAEEALREAKEHLELRVTERTEELKKAVSRAGAERQRFIDVLETLPAYVILLTPDYHVAFANSVFRERFGESHGKRCYEFLFDRTEPCENCETYTVLKTMKPQEWKWTGPDGRNYDIYDYPFTDSDGATLILEMGIDVTVQKRAEGELRDINYLLAEMGKAASRKEYLEAVVGHVRDVSGCRCVGVRVLEEGGLIPYDAYTGFSREFWESESGLMLGRDNCICSRIIRGEPEVQESPCVTEKGSFACSDAFGFIEGLAAEERANYRGVCIKAGFRTLAVIPVHYKGKTVAAIHLADEREGVTPLKIVESIERLTPFIGEAVHKLDIEDRLRRNYQELVRTNEELESEIAAHRLAEEALRESERRLKEAERVALLGHWELDLVTNRLYWSDEVYRIFDIDQKRFGASYEAFINTVHPDDRDFVNKSYTDSVRDRTPYDIMHRLLMKDGSVKFVNEKCSTVYDDNGKPLRSFGIVTDVTERTRLEEELRKMQKLESVGLLAGGIAHDFNNALAAILMNISLARMSEDPGSRGHRLLAGAEKAALRARGLTRQLLTFSKGGAPVRKAASLRDLVMESADFALTGSGVRCEYSLPDGLWPAEVDEGQINQVINNLVINAQQAMPRGGVVEISAENADLGGQEGPPLKEGRYVKLTVRDYGPGIPPEHLPKIFDPYFTTKASGSGLGLATTYAIIKKHSGHITVESRPGEGTAFTIYLPASGEAVEPGAPAGAASAGLAESTGGGRVLVMDDETEIRESLGAALALFGYRVSFARSGEEAIAAYVRARERGRPFDAVVMDLTIPGAMGGREAIGELRRIDPGVRAIVSSGYSNDPVMAEHEKHGFKGVVVKPFKVEEMVRELQKVAAADVALR